ncbi:MAG: hypothetical protein EOP09_09015, partial [Proteobacteria bacterium]
MMMKSVLFASTLALGLTACGVREQRVSSKDATASGESSADNNPKETYENGVVSSALGLHPQVDLSLDPADRNMLLHGHTIPMRDIERFA